MSHQKLPPGWDENRIREVINHYESQDEDDRAAEIDAAWEAEGMTLMSVPNERVSEIRALLFRGQPTCRDGTNHQGESSADDANLHPLNTKNS